VGMGKEVRALRDRCTDLWSSVVTELSVWDVRSVCSAVGGKFKQQYFSHEKWRCPRLQR
jgi:hypothetical protein